MQSFQDLLEKRVRGGLGIFLDEHTVKKTVEMVFLELFGKVGLSNLKIQSAGEELVVESEKSVWRAEILMLREKIIEMINQKLKNQTVKYLKIRG